MLWLLIFTMALNTRQSYFGYGNPYEVHGKMRDSLALEIAPVPLFKTQY